MSEVEGTEELNDENTVKAPAEELVELILTGELHAANQKFNSIIEDKVGELRKTSRQLWESLRLKFDHNNDGEISMSEIQQVPTANRYQRLQLEQLVKMMDKNGNNKVTKDE